MPLADNPRDHIIHMFNMEVRRLKDHNCRIFPDGIRLNKLPLKPNEKIYGVYKERFFFTPLSMIWIINKTVYKFEWKKVISCSTSHGSGLNNSHIKLIDGTKYTFPIRELTIGWSGRIGQLYHAMIEKWKCEVRDEHWVLSIDRFFDLVTTSEAIAPNWYPNHPGLGQINTWLKKLENRSDIDELLLIVSDYDDIDPCVQEVVFIVESLDIDTDIINLKFSYFGPTPEITSKKIGPVDDRFRLISGIWH